MIILNMHFCPSNMLYNQKSILIFLDSSMVERAEMLRDSMEKRTLLDMKKEQEERISDHLEKYKKDLFSEELLIAAMVEQSYDVRLDLNEALLTFCQVRN